MNLIKLSPSKLNEFNACPRCFYDAYALGIKKPRGIFPGLPGGMDRVIKKHFDKYRGSMPPEIKDRVEGILVGDQSLVNKWRNWRTGLSYKDDKNDVVLIGALDDCVVYENPETMIDNYIPLDYKTKGAEPKDDGSQYYQTQLDCYNLMLNSEGCPTKDEGYLVYFYPVEIGEVFGLNIIGADFGISVFKIPCSIDRAKEVIAKAAECLRGIRPAPGQDCEHCQHIADHVIMEGQIK